MRLAGILAALVIILTLTAFVPTGRAQQDIPIIRVEGTYQEMGYQLGFALAPEIMNLVNNYFFTLFDPSVYESAIIPYFQAMYIMPDNYVQEIDGMIQGMQASGTNLYISTIDRDLQAIDLQVANTVTDIHGTKMMGAPFQCSSVTAWGEATLDDPALQGETIHVRNLDWYDTNNHILAESTIIVCRTPSDPQAQRWAAITFPSQVGCLSGINEAGVVVNLNMGNHTQFPSVGGNTPVMLSTRWGIEQNDVNGDGVSTLEDVGASLEGDNLSWSFLLHAAQPRALSTSIDPSAVYEVVLQSRATRFAADDPNLAPWFLVTTNHHRKLYPPSSCWRYTALKNAITLDYEVTCTEAWNYMVLAQQSSTVQTMLFIPSTKELWLSYTDSQGPAPDHTPAVFSWAELFDEVPATPTPQPSPSPTSNPATPTPLPTATIEPTSLPDELTVSVFTNQSIYSSGDSFDAVISYTNGPTSRQALQAIVLDVWGQYWFAPSWTQNFETETRQLEVGFELEESFLEFIWPSGAGTFDGVNFWVAYLSPVDLSLISNVDSCTFGAEE